MKIKLIYKYLFKSVTTATLVCIILFMIVWIAPETLFNTIRDTMKGYFTFEVGVKIILYKIPEILGRALPVGLLLGTLFTFDKLSKDSELTVMRSFGLSFWKIVLAPCILAIFLSYFCFYVHDKMIPYASTNIIKIFNDVREGSFVHTIKDSNQTLKQIIIISKFDSNGLIEGLTVLDFNKKSEDSISALSQITFAQKAINIGKNWYLKDAKQYEISHKGVFSEIQQIKTYPIYNASEAKLVHKLMLYSLKKQKEMTNAQIKEYLTLLKSQGFVDEYNYILNKFIQRYSHSFMCLLFAILGCLLGFSNAREQRLVGFTIAIGLIFIYYITIPFFDMMAEKSIINPFITATIPPFLALILIFVIKKIKDL